MSESKTSAHVFGGVSLLMGAESSTHAEPPVFRMFAQDEKCRLAYAHPGDSGCDLRAHIAHSVLLGPGERTLIPTGLHVKMPMGYELQVRPRSGLALKKGITVLNSPGTIDSGYTGEIGVIVLNTDKNMSFEIKPFDKIAQAVIQQVFHPHWTSVAVHTDLEVTERGAAGFGSTGV